MPVCSICGSLFQGDELSHGCQYPDHMIARKFKKHAGGGASRHQQDPAGPGARPKKWPKFDKDAKAPEVREPVT